MEETRGLVSAAEVSRDRPGVAVRLEGRVASRVLFRSLVSEGLTPQGHSHPRGGTLAGLTEEDTRAGGGP